MTTMLQKVSTLAASLVAKSFNTSNHSLYTIILMVQNYFHICISAKPFFPYSFRNNSLILMPCIIEI